MDYEKVLDLLQLVYEEVDKETSSISRINWKFEINSLMKKIKDRSKYVK